jgi:uncharacterized protein
MDGNSLVTRLTHLFRDQRSRGVVAAYLFGSHAEGRAHRESDVDVGIVLDHACFSTAGDRFEMRLRMHALLGAATESFGRGLDLVVLNDAPPGFAAAVVTRGKLLFCADAELEHAFRRDSQLQAADRRPFLKRAADLKRQAIVR